MDLPPFEVPSSEAPWRVYHKITRTATYSFLMALPLLVLYEGLILFVNRGQVMQVRISAEVWIKRVLPTLGTAGWHVLAAVVLIIGVGVFVYERKKQIPFRPRYCGWMIGESTVYAVVLAFLVSSMVGIIFAAAPVSLVAAQMVEQSLWTKLALSIGAGLYEELLFRVLLVGGMYVALRKLFSKPTYAYVIAAVIGALLFSAVHYIGALGDAFTLPSFTFRFLFGLALNVVFLVRGFGVAAWTHALYDVMIVTGMLG
ncbi:MAG: CPBP family intramembrane glutamic endopeptidase [Rhodothermales bacterium]